MTRHIADILMTGNIADVHNCVKVLSKNIDKRISALKGKISVAQKLTFDVIRKSTEKFANVKKRGNEIASPENTRSCVNIAHICRQIEIPRKPFLFSIKRNF